MLTYLPPLILESESLQILRGAYVSLYSLVNTLFPGPTTKPKAEAYDKIMRTGILNGLQHSGEYVYLSEYLIKQVAELINTMGIHSVKHLKVRSSVGPFVACLPQPEYYSHPSH